jgi:hypothetical protein
MVACGVSKSIPEAVTASQAAGHRWPTSEAVMFMHVQGSREEDLCVALGQTEDGCCGGE